MDASEGVSELEVVAVDLALEAAGVVAWAAVVQEPEAGQRTWWRCWKLASGQSLEVLDW